MIINRPLTIQEQHHSQKCWRDYIALNATALILSGENVLILLAVGLRIPDALIATIGALTYLSYLVLPIGFRTAAYWGVGKSVKNQCILTSFLCLLIALAGVLPTGAQKLFYISLIGLYLCRSASAAMHFPLLKNITDAETLPKIQANNQIAGAVCSLATNLLVAFLLAHWSGNLVLALLLTAGAIISYLAGLRAAKVIEPNTLKQFAARPVLPQILLALRNQLLRKQLLAGCILNLSLAMMVPINVLAAKRGLNLPNGKIILLATLQTLSAIGGSWCCRLITERYGPRQAILLSFPLIWLLALCWWLIPADTKSFLPLMLPFVTAGLMTVFYTTSLGSYFMLSIPNRLQIGGTFLVYVVTGGFIGALGMILNPLFFKLASCHSWETPITVFRIYFTLCALLQAGGIFALISLPVAKKN